MENVTCKHCSSSFEFSNTDPSFYERLSPNLQGLPHLIPKPKLCPTCRNVRRMAWRNDRTFYNRKCDLSAKKIIALYPQDAPFPVYHQSEWYGDKWDPLDYGRELDLTRPFFEQWHELMQEVPRLGLDVVNCENSDYCNYCGDDKNCYLDIAGEANEDCYFNLFTKYSKDCVDCTFVYHSTLCYQSISCYNSYNARYSMYLNDCSDCFFCYDLKGCKNCLFCINLRNKEYCLFNKQYTKAEYEQKLAERKLGNHASVQDQITIWEKWRMEHGIYRDMYTTSCENCFGNNIAHSKNCHSVFNASNCEDSHYLYDVLDAKDCQDLNYSLYHPELSYELISTLQMKFSAFNMASHYCSSVFYCDLTNSSQDLFGCIGLKQKQYCILNKQYSKDDYEDLASKLVQHMQHTGEWGEFFPIEISPFAYNETVAQEYAPLTKEEALASGYRWIQYEKKEVPPQRFSIAEDIEDIADDIVSEVLYCEQCSKNYRIVQQELRFYRSGHLPVPRCCPQCRHLQRIERRNSRRLWERNCCKCDQSIHTTFPPMHPARVYCENCYLQEVY